MRAAAFTGSRQPVDDWFAGRQWGRWVTQGTNAYPPPASAHPPASAATAAQKPADPAETLRRVTELHERGVIDDAEFARLRARLHV